MECKETNLELFLVEHQVFAHFFGSSIGLSGAAGLVADPDPGLTACSSAVCDSQMAR